MVFIMVGSWFGVGNRLETAAPSAPDGPAGFREGFLPWCLTGCCVAGTDGLPPELFNGPQAA